MASIVKIGFWNIHCHRSKILGDKLVDNEFLNVISDCDIIGLGEIQSHDEVSLPGFVSKKQKIRKKNSKGPRIAGGVGVFVKEGIDHLVDVMPNDIEDSIWVKIKGELNGSKEDMYLGTYYVSPYNKKNKNFDFFSVVNEEIAYFNKKGQVHIQGDLNARTGTECDRVEAPDINSDLGFNGGDEIKTFRNSEDSCKNPRGNELLDICKANDLMIVNGRTIGDLFGKYTCHNWNGSSVVDYFLTPYDLIDKVQNFSVGEYIPWLSDHCIIKTVIKASSIHRKAPVEEKFISVHPGFKWNENSKERFLKSLKCEDVSKNINEIMNKKPPELYNEVKTLLFDCAAVCLSERKKISPTKSEKWFDDECEKIKSKISNLGKKLRKTPTDFSIRDMLNREKKNFKKVTLAKKRRYKKGLMSELEEKFAQGSQKELWSVFKKISPKTSKSQVRPSLKTFSDYFKDLFKTKRPQRTPPMSTEFGPLDGCITLEELFIALKALKEGKASGLDNICVEMVIILGETYPQILLKLFNGVLMTGDIPSDWVYGMIVPIYKEGQKLDPSNYRGITLSSCLGKLFLTILNGRLAKFTTSKKLLAKSQLGFIAGNRTSDAHIIIHNLIRKVCHENNEKIYSCFVDFRKAFDSIPRDIMLQKLQNLGLTGKFFNIIRKIYTTDRSCVKIDKSRSELFDIDLGVRQGCVLSPLLFNLFVSDLAKSLDSYTEKFEMMHTSINSLFWADDLILMAKTEEGLKALLKTLEQYCLDNEIEINTKKTNCMIFNKTGRLMRRAFYLNSTALECVRSYKYLGFKITPSGEITTGLKDLRDRALKAFFKLKRDLGTDFNSNIKTSLFLIDALVKPILLYASDFWGCFKLDKSNPIDNFGMMMYKNILGVRKQTVNIGVLLELGRVPMHFESVKLATKNWERIRYGKANTLLRDSFDDSMQNKFAWTESVRLQLSKCGMLNFFLNHQDKAPFVFKKLYQRLCDMFYQQSFSEIKQDTSKLRTYGLLKGEMGLENYLLTVRNIDVRRAVTKLRLSDHDLMIEKGRYSKTTKDQRFCPNCPNIVEDEFHFLFSCKIFSELRARLLIPTFDEIAGFHNLDMKNKIKSILSDPNGRTCDYIAKCLEVRKFLLSKPKRIT